MSTVPTLFLYKFINETHAARAHTHTRTQVDHVYVRTCTLRIRMFKDKAASLHSLTQQAAH